MVAPYAPTSPAQRWFPFAFGGVALAGFLGTLLPMWSITVDPAAFRRSAIVAGSGVSTDQGRFRIDVGFYDWVVSGRPVGAVLPLVLAMAVAVAVAAALSGPDRTLWGITAAAAACTVIIVVGTAIRPDSKREVTGQFAERMKPSEVTTIQDPTPIDAGIGAGLVLALISVALLGGLAAWQYYSTRELNR